MLNNGNSIAAISDQSPAMKSAKIPVRSIFSAKNIATVIAFIFLFAVSFSVGTVIVPRTFVGASESTTSVATISTTPEVNSSSSAVTTSEALATGNGLKITINQVVKDTLELDSTGYTYWLFTVTLVETGSSSVSTDPYYFQLVSNTEAVYPLTFASAEQDQLQLVTLSFGQHTTGQVAFELPNGESPSVLEYNDQLDGIDLKINSPSEIGSVSYFQSWIASVVPYNISFGAYFTVQNSSDYFYTGQTVDLNVSIVNCCSAPAKVTSITVSGLRVLGMSPSLPITVDESANYYVNVYVLSPSTAYDGAILVDPVNLTVTFS